MQHIDTTQSKIIEARDKHFKFMSYIIKRKLYGNSFSGPPPIPDMNKISKASGIKSTIFKFFSNDDNLRIILIGEPHELDSIKDKFTSIGMKKSLKKLINYDSWIKHGEKDTYRNYNAYHLAEKLDIPTCVYCNRIYTKTVISCEKKITRPAFDHWFSKTDFPLLALSFYNLIPSCTVCNSGIKGSVPFSLNTHFHPYFKNTAEIFKYTFSYDHKAYDKFSFKIITAGDSFSDRSVKAFELEEIYKAHENEIEDLRKIKDTYSESYIDMLETAVLDGVTIDREEVYRLAFGVHFQEAMFDRRPLSKMKKDILIELGIVS